MSKVITVKVSSILTITTKITWYLQVSLAWDLLREDAMFYGNPLEMTLEDVDEVINYFENTEEYEKCSELVEYKNILDLDMFLKKLRIKNGQTIM